MPPSLCYHKRSNLSSLFFLPTSVLALLLLLLLACNYFTVFYLYISVRDDSSQPTKFPETGRKLSTNVIYAVEEEQPLVLSNPTTQTLQLDHSDRGVNDNGSLQNFSVTFNNLNLHLKTRKKRKRRKKKGALIKMIKAPPHLSLEVGRPMPKAEFSNRVKEFFWRNNSCKLRFFMTWISSLQTFGNRELFTIESLFKSHPTACLLILSSSIDSTEGSVKVLQPFLNRNFHIAAISPHYESIFKNTTAASWFDRLRKGNIKTGEVSLGQNLSNLLRLALLYKYGGIYMDTDFLVLKSFKNLRNVIGAQNVDRKTKKWNRLNNALMIFDKKHPLLSKFIDEFVLTFNGNKWGFNGPYLVTRVVERVLSGYKPEFNFSVLPPPAFYPVDWSGIGGLFKGGKDDDEKWLRLKLEWIRRESYAVHLWNRQSRRIEVEEGSIISHLMMDTCVFCNFSALEKSYK